MRTYNLAILLFTLISHSIASASELKCGVDTQACKFSGVLELRTNPGPPNYSDIKKGDEAETHLYIKTDHIVKIHFEDWDKHGVPAEEENTVFQVAGDFDEKLFKVAKGKNHVVLIGTAFESFSGHHHTHFLIDVTDQIIEYKK